MGVREGRGDDAAWVEGAGVGVGGQKGEGEGEGVSKAERCQWKAMMVMWGKGEKRKGTPLIYDGGKGQGMSPRDGTGTG